MSSIIKTNIKNFRIKDISKTGIIDYKDSKNNIQIKTEKEKFNQNKDFIHQDTETNLKSKVINTKRDLLINDVKSQSEQDKFIKSDLHQSVNSVNNSNITNKTINIKDDYKVNQSVEDSNNTSKKKYTENNRKYISRKVLKLVDKGTDVVLSLDEEDLGIDTIRKVKLGIKDVSIIGAKRNKIK